MNMKKHKWLLLEDDGWQIIMPEFDKYPHATVKISETEMELAGFDCPCKPKVNWLDRIISHNSFIEKEAIEKAMSNFSTDK